MSGTVAFYRFTIYYLERAVTSVADPGSEMAKIRIRIQDPDPDPGSRSGMNNPDHIYESLQTIFWVKILTFLDVGFGITFELDRGNLVIVCICLPPRLGNMH